MNFRWSGGQDNNNNKREMKKPKCLTLGNNLLNETN